MRKEILASLAAVLAGSGLVMAGPYGQPPMGTQNGQVISSQVVSSEPMEEHKGWRPGALIRRIKDKHNQNAQSMSMQGQPVIMHQGATTMKSGTVITSPQNGAHVVSSTSSPTTEKKGRLMSRIRGKEAEEIGMPVSTMPSTTIQQTPRPMPSTTAAEPPRNPSISMNTAN